MPKRTSGALGLVVALGLLSLAFVSRPESGRFDRTFGAVGSPGVYEATPVTREDSLQATINVQATSIAELEKRLQTISHIANGTPVTTEGTPLAVTLPSASPSYVASPPSLASTPTLLTGSPSADDSNAGTPTAASGIGSASESMQLNGFDLAVTEVERASSVDAGFEQYTARGEFVVIHLTLTNLASSPAEFAYENLVLVTGEGRTYTFDRDATTGLFIGVFNLSTYEALQPGIPYELAVVFDISTESTNIKLVGGTNDTYIDLDAFGQ